MLEHPDRHDPVEGAGDRTIVDQFEPDMIGDPSLLGSPARDLQLLFRQRDSGDVDSGDLVQIDRRPAPAAADVEHPLAGLQVQLGGDMRLLVGLGLLQAVSGIGEVSAAILPVVVEEELVQFVL